MFKYYLLLIVTFSLLSGCSDNSSKFPSPEGMSPPYILKEDCQFSIVEEFSRASITSPKLKGLDIATASAGISLGDKSIMVANCKVTENSHDLPIYEQ